MFNLFSTEDEKVRSENHLASETRLVLISYIIATTVNFSK